MNQSRTDSGKRIGQGMWMVFWLLLLAALAWFFGLAEEKREYPNQSVTGNVTDLGRELVLDANRAGHYTLTGSINDQPARFLLDTGASDVVIPENIANSLNLERGQTKYASTANGTIKVYHTELQKLQLGPIVLHDVRASINPHMQGDILLGMSALRSLELVHRNDTLLIRQRY